MFNCVFHFTSKGSFLKKVWSKAEEGGHTSLCGTTPLEKAEVRQWIEYSVTKVRPLSTAPSGKKNKLKEILQVCVTVDAMSEVQISHLTHQTSLA